LLRPPTALVAAQISFFVRRVRVRRARGRADPHAANHYPNEIAMICEAFHGHPWHQSCSIRAEEPMDTASENVTGTILIVDDDEGVRKLLARWVAALGYTVKVAPDAETALSVLRSVQIDVALCDVRMPGHDGIWLVEQMRRFHPSVAVVLATGLLEMDPMVTLQPGVVGYIVKPFNREDLEQVVKRGMAERSRLQAEQTPGPRLLSAGVLDGIVLSTD